MFHDSAHVLLIIERLINEIERTGLYTIGIYRKPGPAAKIKQLIKHINTSSGNLHMCRNIELLLCQILSKVFVLLCKYILMFYFCY